MNMLQIILIIIIFIAIVTAIINISSNETNGIYFEPGTCPHCGKPLEKTVVDYRIIWYCSNNKCKY